MKTITATAFVLVALATATVTTMWGGTAHQALASPQMSSAIIQIDVLTANARDLPVQSFDAF